MSKYLVAGISHMHGTSDQGRGSKYDMKRAVVLSEQAPVDSSNRVLESHGLNAIPMNLSDECYRKLQIASPNLDYPLELDFVENIDLSSGQPRVVFTDVRIPQVAPKQ
jgi:hypothetical protein